MFEVLQKKKKEEKKTSEEIVQRRFFFFFHFLSGPSLFFNCYNLIDSFASISSRCCLLSVVLLFKRLGLNQFPVSMLPQLQKQVLEREGSILPSSAATSPSLKSRRKPFMSFIRSALRRRLFIRIQIFQLMTAPFSSVKGSQSNLSGKDPQ